MFKTAFAIGFGFYLGRGVSELIGHVVEEVWTKNKVDDKICNLTVREEKSKPVEKVEMGFHLSK